MRACWKIFPCVLLLSSFAGGYEVGFEQSECLPHDGDLKDVIEVTVQGCDLHIAHLNVVINCCLEYAPEVEVDGSTIRATEVDVGPPCDCVCPFDLEIVVRGLEPGQYKLYFNAFLHGEILSYDVEIPPCDDFWLYGSEVWSPMGIQDVAMPIHASNPRPVQAFSFGTRFPVEHCRVTALDLTGTITEELGPEFVYFDTSDPSTGPGDSEHGWAVCGIVFDRVLDPPPIIDPPIIDPPIADAKAMPPGAGQHVATLVYDILPPGETPMRSISVPLVDGLGDPPVPLVFLVDGREIIPRTSSGIIQLTFPPVFIRADANDDGTVDISDAVYLLQFLFLAGPPPPCDDAADSNDDGTLDLSDAVAGLMFLFLGGSIPPPAPPGPPGPDPTLDSLGCLRGE